MDKKTNGNSNIVKIGVELVVCVSCDGSGKTKSGKGKGKCRGCKGKGKTIGEVASVAPPHEPKL